MVTGLHDWDLELLGPDFGGPISNGEEVLEMHGVSVHGVDRTVMLTLFVTPSALDLSLFVSVLTHESVTLFTSNQELVGVGVLIIAERSSTVGLAVFYVGILEDELVGGGIHVSHIPPKDASVSRAREEFVTGSGTSQPRDIVHGVVMGLLEDGGDRGLDDTAGVTFSQIVHADGTIVTSTSNDTLNFVMPLHAAEGRGRFKGDFGRVGVVDVPDVGRLGHAEGLLLESQLGVGTGQSVVRPINLPSDFCNSSLNLIGVLENHERFSVDFFTHIFSLLSGEVLLEHVDFVVLLHTSLRGAGQVSSSGSESESRVSVKLLVVTLDVLVVLRVDLGGPSSHNV